MTSVDTMRKSLGGILLAAAFAVPSLGASWTLRPGLWEQTHEIDRSNLTAEQQTVLNDLDKKIPPHKVQALQFCQKPGAETKSMFDPANQPPGTCQEKILSDGPGGREIEDRCILPTENPQFTRPARAYRHIIQVDGAEVVDRAEVMSDSLTIKFRWLNPDCGNVKAK